MGLSSQDDLKQQAARKAAAMVPTNAVIGVGTGSTVAFFITELGRRLRSGDLQVKAVVTTSNRSRDQLIAEGFTVSELSAVDHVDLTVDGADRVDDNLNGIKGGGGALTLEKNVAVNSRRNIWIVDESKQVSQLGGFPLPVEVLPISCEQVARRLDRAGLKPHFRLKEDQKTRYLTHYGNYILDLDLAVVPVPEALGDFLKRQVGVVEHGLFLNLVDTVIVAHQDGTIEELQR